MRCAICDSHENDKEMVACDICDQWFHVQCCGLAKEQSEKIAGSFMCKGCHAEGFMGGGADWYIEPADSKPVPLPESSSSEEEDSEQAAAVTKLAPAEAAERMSAPL